MFISGYDVCRDDVIAIARLRGPQLQTLDIPHCCISTVDEDEDQVWVSIGAVGPDFSAEVTAIIIIITVSVKIPSFTGHSTFLLHTV